jgi:cellobiose-specific phosphotransferase system component IIB
VKVELKTDTEMELLIKMAVDGENAEVNVHDTTENELNVRRGEAEMILIAPAIKNTRQCSVYQFQTQSKKKSNDTSAIVDERNSRSCHQVTGGRDTETSRLLAIQDH